MSYNPNNPNGQATMANSQPVAIASDQSAVKIDGSAVTQPISNTSLTNVDGNLGAKADGSASSDSGTFSLIALIKRLLSKLPGLGQLTMANSQSVAIASDQSTVPVSAASLPLPSGAATAAKQPALGTAGTPSSDVLTVQGAASGTALSVTDTRLPSALGQAAAASSLAVTLSNENVQDLFITGQSAQTAIVNNILPATSGANATDVTGYRSFCVQVVSTGTGGTYIFEGSNDNVNFIAALCYNNTNIVGTITSTNITASASAIIYYGPITFRYFRLRIVSTITGGSIQAFSRISQVPFAPAVTQVVQGSAGGLNLNVGQVGGTATLTGSGAVGTGAQRVTIGTGEMPAGAAASDATANPTTSIFRNIQHLFNGTSWDRFYNNINASTGDSGAKTTTFNGATQTNFNARGAKITLLIGAVSGTVSTFQCQIQFSPDGGTTWLAYGPASSTFTPASSNTVLFDIYPTNFSVAGATPAALTSGATQNVQINGTLPRTWRFTISALSGTTPSVTITGVYVNTIL